MNLLAEELVKRFEEVSPRDFYRDIFPVGSLDKKDAMTKGKYCSIAMEIEGKKFQHGKKQKVRRYTVTDDLDIIDKLTKSRNFCILAPISYCGKERTAENARELFALCVELDNLPVRDGEIIGLSTLLYRLQVEGKPIGYHQMLPMPTYLVASGNGLHLYYLFDRPLALFPNVVKSLQAYKKRFTRRLWMDGNTTTWKESEVQYESIFQAFRMVGTTTKAGDTVRAFRTGGRVTVERMNEVARFWHWNCEIESGYVSKLPLSKAQEKYPDWYDKRIVRQVPKGCWTCNRALYDWWKGKGAEAELGHRYFCLMILAIYAIKCGISYDELEKDCLNLRARLNADDKNPLTEQDAYDALQAYFDKSLVTYPVNSIINRSGITFERPRRNGRTQVQHLKIARRAQEVDDPDGSWRNTDGRPTAEETVRKWCAAHPNGRKADCVRETGLAKHTVYRWWKND